MHTQLSAAYGTDWYDNAAVGLDNGSQKKVAQAKYELQKNRYAIDPPHVIAALSFGFWVSLLGAGGFMDASRTVKSNYKMTLWRPALRKAFPHAAALSRKKAHAPLNYLRTFRNRIAHHEPVFQRHLQKDYQSILDVTGWISPHKKDWIEAHSRVDEILAMPHNEKNIRF